MDAYREIHGAVPLNADLRGQLHLEAAQVADLVVSPISLRDWPMCADPRERLVEICGL